jgi:hypothetical protein
MKYKDDIEEFSDTDVKDSCHYICSSLTWLNVFLTLILVVLIYLYFIPSSNT